VDSEVSGKATAWTLPGNCGLVAWKWEVQWLSGFWKGLEVERTLGRWCWCSCREVLGGGIRGLQAGSGFEWAAGVPVGAGWCRPFWPADCLSSELLGRDVRPDAPSRAPTASAYLATREPGMPPSPSHQIKESGQGVNWAHGWIPFLQARQASSWPAVTRICTCFGPPYLNGSSGEGASRERPPDSADVQVELS
jgi:hypothetical protein